MNSGSGTVTLHSTIVAGNTELDQITASNIVGNVATASSHNLVGSGSVGVINGVRGNIVESANNDPMLGGLADNGGTTLTHVPLPGSPVIGAGDPSRVYDVGEFDQRGFARVLGGRIDIGAVEAAGPVIVAPIPHYSENDLGDYVPNLDFDEYLSLPTDYNYQGEPLHPYQIALPGAPDATVTHWKQLTTATPDYDHSFGWLGEASESGISPPREDGGFAGLVVQPDVWMEYVVNILPMPLAANEEYYFDLFVGTTSEGGNSGGAFEGKVVVYGILDASSATLMQYHDDGVFIDTLRIEDIAGSNVVELLAIDVDQAAYTWNRFRRQVISPEIAIEGLVFGARSEQDDYVLVDATAPTPPPQVTDVRLIGSQWPSEPGIFPREMISYRDVSSFGGPTVGSGIQLTPVPVEGIGTIEIEFSEAMAVTEGDLTILTSTGVIDEFVAFDPDPDGNPNTHVARWTLSSPLIGQFTLSLNESGTLISSLGGLELDGEWDRPASLLDMSSSTFSSGDGTPGGEFLFDFSVLPGDYNRNGTVDAADYTVWQNQSGSSGGLEQFSADGDDDGDVDAADYDIWHDSFGHALELLDVGV